MARPRNGQQSKTLELAMPAGAHARLLDLVKIGHYGSNAAEVARYLIVREIDDLTHAGVLKPRDK